MFNIAHDGLVFLNIPVISHIPKSFSSGIRKQLCFFHVMVVVITANIKNQETL